MTGRGGRVTLVEDAPGRGTALSAKNGTIVVRWTDDRLRRMAQDPDTYFRQAQLKARSAVKRDNGETQRDRKPQKAAS